MKIQGIYNSGEIDTNDFPEDVAKVFEKQHEVCLLAMKHDVPYVGFIFGSRSCMSQHIVKENATAKQAGDRITKLLNDVDAAIRRLTQNQFCIARIMEKDENQQ